jgi:hypothetical protein
LNLFNVSGFDIRICAVRAALGKEEAWIFVDLEQEMLRIRSGDLPRRSQAPIEEAERDPHVSPRYHLKNGEGGPAGCLFPAATAVQG